MSYAERPVASPLVCCTWEQTAGGHVAQRVVPDGCVDLVLGATGLHVAGPDTGPRVVALAPGERVVGARMRPGAAGAVLGLPAHALRDAQPDAAEVLGRDAAERLIDAVAGGEDPHALLLGALLSRPAAPDPLVAAAVASLDRPGARVAAVAAELGVTERTLHRRVADAVGLGPKVLARVLRLRRLTAQDDAAPLALRALDAGYADQAHMTAEVTRLTGLSPVRFLKDRTPTAA